MLRKGELVQFLYKPDGWASEKRLVLVTVLEYEPDVLGGSSIHSYRDPDTGRMVSYVSSEPVRGRALVMSTEFDLMTWCDEAKLVKVKLS
jgi:hypothetical protein